MLILILRIEFSKGIVTLGNYQSKLVNFFAADNASTELQAAQMNECKKIRGIRACYYFQNLIRFATDSIKSWLEQRSELALHVGILSLSVKYYCAKKS